MSGRPSWLDRAVDEALAVCPTMQPWEVRVMLIAAAPTIQAAATEGVRALHQPYPPLSAEDEARRRRNGWKTDMPQTCRGCDNGGYEGDPTPWPCPTYALVGAP